MRFEFTLWKFIKEYLFKVVVLWSAIFSIFSLVVHLIIKLWLGKDVPIQYWILLVVLGVFIAQSVVYYRIARRQIPSERIEDGLKSISNLRAEGVNKLQNVDKDTIKTAEDLKRFQDEFLKWRNSVIRELEIVSPSQASIFQVLGLVKYRASIKDYHGEVKEGLEKTLSEIADYTNRIKELVDRFSVENLANRVKK